MKRIAGFTLLLLVALLVSLPVAADVLAASDDLNECVTVAPETKIFTEEEVIAYSGEIMTVQSAAPTPAEAIRPSVVMIYGGLESGNSCGNTLNLISGTRTDRMAGGDRLYVGHG